MKTFAPFIILMLGTGCSQIQYVTNIDQAQTPIGFSHDENNQRYSSTIFAGDSVAFSVNVTTYPSDSRLPRLMSFGPPLLPVIPNPFALFGIWQPNYVEVYIAPLLQRDSNIVRTGDIHIVLDDGTNLQPSRIRGYLTAKWAPAALYFDMKQETKRFQILFGPYRVNSDSTVIPTLTYNRSDQYRYVPWVKIPWDH